VVLPTAWVDLHTTEGRRIPVRAFLDQYATLSFISESFCRTLRTKRQRIDVTINGVAGMKRGGVRTRVSLGLFPRGKPVLMIPLGAYVLPKIIAYTAPRALPLDTWPHLRGIELADPDPSSQHPIHMLIGSNLFTSIFVPEHPRLGPKDLSAAQKTVFGWILSGPAGIPRPVPDKAHVSPCAAESDTNVLLPKFWVQEEVPQRLPLKEEDEPCENYFASTRSRTAGDRCIVRLPFKASSPIAIGDSQPIATNLYARMKDRLQSRLEISRPYIDSAFCDFASALDTLSNDSRNVEDAYSEAAGYPQEAIGSYR